MKINLKKVQYLMSFVMLMQMNYSIKASSSAVRASRLLAVQASKSGVKSAATITAPVINPVLTSSTRSLTSNAPKFKVQQQSFSTKIPKDPHAAGAQSSSAKMSMSKKVGVTAGVLAAGAFVWNGISNAYQSVVDAISPIDIESRPNFKQAVSFLKTKCKDMQLATDVDIEFLAYYFTDISLKYREIDKIVDEAQYEYTFQQDRSMVTMDDIDKAIKDAFVGIDNFDNGPVEFHALTIAHHEAGHALVIALHLSELLILYQAYRFKNSGITRAQPLSKQKSWLEDLRYKKQDTNLYEFKLVMLFAGGIAQNMLLSSTMLDQYKDKPEYLELSQQEIDVYDFNAFMKQSELSSDMEEAVNIAYRTARLEVTQKAAREYKDENIEDKVKIKADEILRAAHRKTIEILAQHKDLLKEIADVIYEEGSISGQRVYEIVGTDAPMLHFEHDRIIDEIEGDFYDYR